MKAVFLDRDNTLIENDGDLGEPERVQLREGVAEALRALRESGYRLIVVTNQGGVARGAYTERDVDAVHQRIAELVDAAAGTKGIIDRFYYCPYHPEGSVEEYRREHPWRKPQPGMLIQAARDLGLDLSQCWMIGDQLRDMQAGEAAGCKTVFLNADESIAHEFHDAVVVKTMHEAADAVLRRSAATMAGRTGATKGRKVPDKPTKTKPATSASGATPGDDEPAEQSRKLRQAICDLTEELRAERLRRTDFTVLRMAAGLCQLLVLLFALLAIMQSGHFEPFLKWLGAAVLLQLVTITFVLLDNRG